MGTLQDIFSTLANNKMRTLLSITGVAWGLLMLMLLLGSGKGLRNGMEGGFTSDVSTSIWFISHRTSIPYEGLASNRAIQYKESDLVEIQKRLGDEIKHISAENFVGNRIVSHFNKNGNFDVLAVGPDYFSIKAHQDYYQGRRLNKLDGQEKRKVVAIGKTVAETLFPNHDKIVESHIKIDGLSFKVVGVFDDPGWNGTMSKRIYMPLTTYKQVWGIGNEINLFSAVPEDGVDGFSLEDKILELLRERHKISPRDTWAVYANNLADERQSIIQLNESIERLVWILSIGTLIAGAVGTANIMLISVAERAKEIGTRKALGATPSAVITSILLEAIALTTLAGALGIAIGIVLIEQLAAWLVEHTDKFPAIKNPSIEFSSVLLAMAVLVVVGALAGFAPALRAARVTPIAAMRL